MDSKMLGPILVTGGAGFIGGEFVRQLISETQVSVVNLDKLTYAGNLSSLSGVLDSPRHCFAHADICDSKFVDKLLKRCKPSAIVHFAAESHVDRSIDSPEAFVETNVVGTFRMLEAARKYFETLPEPLQKQFRFLHVSTDEVYGSLGDTGAFTEETPYAPNSPYSASKASSDHFVRAYFHTYGLPTLITNCSNNFGPYQYPEKLIPLMILNCLAGRPLPIYGDGKQVRDWLFVSDHCRALRLVLHRGRIGDVYNIGGASELTNLEVVETICRTIDELCPNLKHKPCKQLVQFVKDRPGHDRRYAIDFKKIETQLGWRPKNSFESNIRETVSWYLKNQAWLTKLQPEIFSTRRGIAA